MPSLTGLRWVAAVMVFFFHLRNMQYFDDAGQSVLSLLFGGGATAVSLFFILSGFVLTFSGSGESVGRFYVRRLARIYPLHLTALALATWVGATLFPPIRTMDPMAVVANILLMNSWRAEWWQAGNPVSWSLSCEAFFYLTFPVWSRLLTRRTSRTLWFTLAGCLILVVCMPALLGVLLPTAAPYSFPLARLPEFVGGICAALLVRDHGWRIRRLRGIVGFALVSYAAATTLSETPYGSAAVTALPYTLLIVALATSDLRGSRTWLTRVLLQRLGSASFAFYLLHLLALQSALVFLTPERPALGGVIAAGGVLVGATSLAWVVHKGIEEPLNRLLLR